MKAGWMTMPLAFFAALAFLFVASTSGAGPAVDTDGDGVRDEWDNCVSIANPDQRDTDYDSLGNLCDADYDNNNDVALADFGALRAAFGSSVGDAAYSEHIDTDDSGDVGLGDFGLLRAQFGGPPGPGGRGCETSGSVTGEDCPVPALPL